MSPWPGPASSRSHSPSTTAPATRCGRRPGRRTARSGRRSSARPRTTLTTEPTAACTSSRPRRRSRRSAGPAPTTTSPTTRSGRSWPGLGAADLTPDDDHRFDLDGVYDIAAENPDRWAVEELAATHRHRQPAGRVPRHHARATTRSSTTPRPRASSRPSPSWPPSPRSAPWAWASRRSSAAPARTPGSASAARSTTSGRTSSRSSSEHLDWTGAGTVGRRGLPGGVGGRGASSPDDDVDPRTTSTDLRRCDRRRRPASRTIARRQPAHRHARPRSPRPRKFWEAVGILPVEVVVPEGAGVTLRCYVEDVARFLGRDGEVFVFDTPADLARFCRGQRGPRPHWRSPPGPRSPTPTSRRCPPTRTATTSPSCPRCWRGRRRRRRAGRPPGASPSRSRASATSPSTPASPGSRSCSPRSSPLGRAVGAGRARAGRDPAARGRRRAAPAVGRGRHPGQRSPGLPRLTD